VSHSVACSAVNCIPPHDSLIHRTLLLEEKKYQGTHCSSVLRCPVYASAVFLYHMPTDPRVIPSKSGFETVWRERLGVSFASYFRAFKHHGPARSSSLLRLQDHEDTIANLDVLDLGFLIVPTHLSVSIA